MATRTWTTAGAFPGGFRLSRFLQDTRRAQFDWLKVLRKEYGTPFAWLSGLSVLLVLEHVAAVGAPPIGRVELAAIVAAWIALAIVYLIVRRLKLSGRLGTT